MSEAILRRGIRPGINCGAAGGPGYNPIENILPDHDFHATVLYLSSIDHTKLTYRFQGRDFRLTDVHGRVVKDILS